MPNTVNPDWKHRIEAKWLREEMIDETVSYNKAAAWLVVYLTQNNTPFKVYNMGAGVKRITTNTDACPCCKHKL